MREPVSYPVPVLTIACAEHASCFRGADPGRVAGMAMDISPEEASHNYGWQTFSFSDPAAPAHHSLVYLSARPDPWNAVLS